ncbi:hypothetical protein HYU92_02665 [Candidatus Curtissbacteria bacterium]|nr:hypothetical protein [Candidatus Curtissbacteria bacterium]
MSAHKFRYFQAPRQQNEKVIYVPIPLIDVVINYKRGQMFNVLALVDSGASVNLFPASLGEKLGINIPKGKKHKIAGIGDIQIDSFLHEGIGIFIEGHKIETNAYFSYQQQIPLLGQNGFFDKCHKVLFNRKEEEIIISI